MGSAPVCGSNRVARARARNARVKHAVVLIARPSHVSTMFCPFNGLRAIQSYGCQPTRSSVLESSFERDYTKFH
eukprot:2888103-Lingulodinium_polyedra.AAC.1